MIVTLQTQRVRTLEQIRRVVEGTEAVDSTAADRDTAYELIDPQSPPRSIPGQLGRLDGLRSFVPAPD